MFVRFSATMLAAFGLSLPATAESFPSGRLELIEFGRPLVADLSLAPAETSPLAIAGQSHESLASELVGITNFPLVDCPRCDESVFVDQQSPLSYIRQLTAPRSIPVDASMVSQQEGPGEISPPRIACTIELRPQLFLTPHTTTKTRLEQARSDRVDEDYSSEVQFMTPGLKLTLALLCGGGILGMFCLVWAAERTRLQPNPPRPTFDDERSATSTIPATVRPPWKCFLTLGVAPGSPLEEIKQAYRERALAVHPDRGGDVETFLELTSAFEQAVAYATTYQLMMADAERRDRGDGEFDP